MPGALAPPRLRECGGRVAGSGRGAPSSRADGPATATATATGDASDAGDAGWSLRLVEQAGRGIGSLTFTGAEVLGRHLALCFPPGHWHGKRVLELGGGAGMLGVSSEI